MKKATTTQRGLTYWQEIAQLLTKAGAFGIINLFSTPTPVEDTAGSLPANQNVFDKEPDYYLFTQL